MDNLPKGDRPDWGRVMVSGPSQLAAVQLGDPVRWGANVNFNLDLSTGGVHILRSGQIISAQCRDAYSRGWSIVGSLSYHSLIFTWPNPPPNTGLVPGDWAAILSCTMGVGQSQVVHNYDLRAIIAADRPFYRSSDNTIGGLVGPLTAADQQVEAFVIPGAVVASMVSIQVIIAIDLGPPTPGQSIPFGCNVLLNPFAAGTHL